MVSNLQMLSDLNLIMEADHRLELLTIYKGVPFIAKVKIIRIENDTAWVVSSDPAIICLQTERLTPLLGSDYFEPGAAQVMNVDVKTGIITLSNFSYAMTKLGERTIVRVHPDGLIAVLLEVDRQKIQGALADISISGLGALISEAGFTNILRPGTNLNVKIDLPKGEVAISGTILSVIRKDNMHRLSIRFGTDGSKIKIFHYLIDRRAEINEELNQKFQDARNKA